MSELITPLSKAGDELASFFGISTNGASGNTASTLLSLTVATAKTVASSNITPSTSTLLNPTVATASATAKTVASSIITPLASTLLNTTVATASATANAVAASSLPSIGTLLTSMTAGSLPTGSPQAAAAPSPLSTLASPTLLSPMAPSTQSTLSLASATASIPTAAAAAVQGAAQTASQTFSAALSSLSQVPIVKQGGKGPFIPQAVFPGGVPTTTLDLPITAVFLVMFIMGAVTHFTIHEINGKRGHKFHLSDAVFDFCMVRTVTCTMRIVWSFRPTNASIELAALIFENAGVVVLFAVNVLFTQRIVRAVHPNFGWSKPANTFFLLVLVSVPIIIINNIIFVILLFFTQTEKTINIARGFLLLGAVWTMLLSIFPVIVVGLATTIPSSMPVEKFGAGRFRSKIVLLLFASLTLFVGAITRLLSDLQEHSAENPGEVNSKKTFYTTGFMLEIIVVVVYAVGRVDLRFWIPDGSSGPGDYSKKDTDQEELFQDVDVKMRMSVSSSFDSKTWVDNESEKLIASREEIRRAISDLGLKSDIVGQPVDFGDSELILYAFRVKKEGGAVAMPKPPPRSSTWYRASRSGGEEMI